MTTSANGRRNHVFPGKSISICAFAAAKETRGAIYAEIHMVLPGETWFSVEAIGMIAAPQIPVNTPYVVVVGNGLLGPAHVEALRYIRPPNTSRKSTKKEPTSALQIK